MVGQKDKSSGSLSSRAELYSYTSWSTATEYINGMSMGVCSYLHRVLLTHYAVKQSQTFYETHIHLYAGL